MSDRVPTAKLGGPFWRFGWLCLALMLGTQLAGSPPAPAAAPARPARGHTQIVLIAGGLTITVPSGSPSAVNLGTGGLGTSISGQLGPVTVSDSRGLSLGWTASVSGSDFKTGGGSASETLTVGHLAYWSGPATSSSGVAVFTPGQATASQKVALSTSAQLAFKTLSVLLNSSATWNPTLVVTVPASAIAGVYTGTITHTVS